MLKKYCKSCGSATYYSSEDPDFCQKCGYSFRGMSASVEKKVSKKSEPILEEAEELDDMDDQPRVDFSTIDGLDVEIDAGATGNVDTFGAIAGTAGDNPLPPQLGGTWLPQVEISQEEFLKQFQKEAGTIRPKDEGR